MWSKVLILSNICHNLKIGIELTKKNIYLRDKKTSQFVDKKDNRWAWAYVWHFQPSCHCIVSLFFLVWAVGDYGRQVGNGHWASKHLEYQTYESYQVGSYWFDNIGTCLGTQRLSNFPAYVQKYR